MGSEVVSKAEVLFTLAASKCDLDPAAKPASAFVHALAAEKGGDRAGYFSETEFNAITEMVALSNENDEADLLNLIGIAKVNASKLAFLRPNERTFVQGLKDGQGNPFLQPWTAKNLVELARAVRKADPDGQKYVGLAPKIEQTSESMARFTKLQASLEDSDIDNWPRPSLPEPRAFVGRRG